MMTGSVLATIPRIRLFGERQQITNYRRGTRHCTAGTVGALGSVQRSPRVAPAGGFGLAEQQVDDGAGVGDGDVVLGAREKDDPLGVISDDGAGVVDVADRVLIAPDERERDVPLGEGGERVRPLDVEDELVQGVPVGRPGVKRRPPGDGDREPSTPGGLVRGGHRLRPRSHWSRRAREAEPRCRGRAR